jgi:methenyltetrahydrofolate cyclohydrolase
LSCVYPRMIQLYGLLAGQGNLTGMRDQTLEAFLGELAARVPAPGGGATAALHAAQAAALLAMVARYSDGPRYDAELMASVVARADKLRDSALTAAEDDAAAFGAVADAYRLPKDTDQEKAARAAAIAQAVAGAARPPAFVVDLARQLTGLAEELLPAGNRNVITDVAAGAEAARAAAVTARVNLEVNLRGIKDPALAAELTATAAVTDEIIERAGRVVAAVREEIAQ